MFPDRVFFGGGGGGQYYYAQSSDKQLLTFIAAACPVLPSGRCLETDLSVCRGDREMEM